MSAKQSGRAHIARSALAAAVSLLSAAGPVAAQVEPSRCATFFDFSRGPADLAPGGGSFLLRNGLSIDRDGHLEFAAGPQAWLVPG